MRRLLFAAMPFLIFTIGCPSITRQKENFPRKKPICKTCSSNVPTGSLMNTAMKQKQADAFRLQ